MEFFGGFYVSLIILGVLIIFFMFGFVFKLMYNEDYSFLLIFNFLFFCVIKFVWMYFGKIYDF